MGKPRDSNPTDIPVMGRINLISANTGGGDGHERGEDAKAGEKRREL